MKKISAVGIIGIFLVLVHHNVFSQHNSEAKTSVIESFPLAITYFKTTNLIFPYAIKSVDRGSKDLLAQKAKDTENILQIKAGRKGFEETNLTVITSNGKLYSYIITYKDYPSVLNYKFIESNKTTSDILFSPATINEEELKIVSEKIAGIKRSIYGKKDKKYGIKFQLEGLYIKEDVLYFKFNLMNCSNLNYDIDQLRFFIRDQKKSKRTASQEQEIKPLFNFNGKPTITGQSKQVLVFALPKFTLSDKKYLAIQVIEKNGGRNLEMKINNRSMVNAKREF